MENATIRFQSDVSAFDFPIIEKILEKFKASNTIVIEEKKDDFYYELSAEDLEDIAISKKQLEMGLGIKNEDVFAEIEKRRRV